MNGTKNIQDVLSIQKFMKRERNLPNLMLLMKLKKVMEVL